MANCVRPPTKGSAEMVRRNRHAPAVLAIVLVGAVCGAGGWLLGARTDPSASGRPTFQAVVESVNERGRTACLAPVDLELRRDFGGSVCGRIFVAPGTDASPEARVRVRWLTSEEGVGGQVTETVETFMLEHVERSD